MSSLYNASKIGIKTGHYELGIMVIDNLNDRKQPCYRVMEVAWIEMTYFCSIRRPFYYSFFRFNNISPNRCSPWTSHTDRPKIKTAPPVLKNQPDNLSTKSRVPIPQNVSPTLLHLSVNLVMRTIKQPRRSQISALSWGKSYTVQVTRRLTPSGQQT